MCSDYTICHYHVFPSLPTTANVSKIFAAVAVMLQALFVVGYCGCCCHWSGLKAPWLHLHFCSLKCEGSPCSLLAFTHLLYFSPSFSLLTHNPGAIIRVIGIRWCWLNWKRMQTGLWGFSARENQLAERTRDSREAWLRTRSTVTHSATLALIKLAEFCCKHKNKFQCLTESEYCHMLATLEVWCQVR